MADIKFDINPTMVKNLFPAIRHFNDLDALKVFAKQYVDSGLIVSDFSIKENLIEWCNIVYLFRGNDRNQSPV